MWHVVLFVAVLLIDQITKILASTFAGGEAGVTVLKIIDNFLEIEYHKNTDGMMGIFENLEHSQLIFLCATCVILIVIFIYMGVAKNRGKWRNATLALILSGAFGNFIDRILTYNEGGYVRDMIHTIIKINGKEIFPYIFNVADMALVVGAIMLLLDLLFIDKDAIFRFKKKENTQKTDENTNENAELTAENGVNE
ncbi:MAG: signal peptidase II [Clostridiales bacterium]|nr:signal peptidase II [Clostridiales bacterium]